MGLGLILFSEGSEKATLAQKKITKINLTGVARLPLENMKYTPLIAVGAVVNFACLGYVTCSQVWSNVTSQTQQQTRVRDLALIARHVRSETCWFNRSKLPFKLNDSIDVAGSEDGKLPTSCIYAPVAKQYLKVGYLDGQLQVLQVFSPKEVQNQLSIKGDES